MGGFEALSPDKQSAQLSLKHAIIKPLFWTFLYGKFEATITANFPYKIEKIEA